MPGWGTADVLAIGHPPEAALERTLGALRAADPTYEEIGATAGPVLPAGYRHDRYSIPLGGTPSAFDRGVAGLRQWEAHRRAGIEVYPHTAAPEAGRTVLLIVTLGPLTVVAGNRIVYAVDDPNRFGLAYGTLPGHPEQGEEAFFVQRHSDGAVTFDIIVFSRPVGLARLGTPVTRALQTRATRRYLLGLQSFVKGEPA